MIALVVTITVKSGHEAAFEKRIKEHAALVRANEPGNIFYYLTKARDEQGVYKVIEMYDSEEALSQHEKTDWFSKTDQICTPIMIRPLEIEFLDVIE